MPRKHPRICYVNPPVLLKRPISELINQLGRKGYDTSLLVPKKLFRKRDESLHHSKLAEEAKVFTYSTVNTPFVGSEQPLPVTPMFCINTHKAIKDKDIIHMWVPYYLTSLKIMLAKKLFFKEKKLILTMDTVPGYSFSMGKTMDALFKIYDKMFGWLIFKTPDIIMLYGESLVPHALKADIPKNKIRVIPTGIDIDKYARFIKEKKKHRQEIRQKLNIKPETAVVLFVGIMVQRKGIDKIIRIADELRKWDVVFLLVGDGPERKKYQDEVEEMALRSKVRFLGFRQDVPKLYQASDIFLLPAEGEGLPGVVMEAMASGLPVVASNIPCIPDLIDNKESGLLCDKDNVEEFTQAVKLLMRDQPKAKALAANALKKIKDFEWKKIIKKYEEVYEELG
jgi:glycosyltransferase involved in cell wall biosynthesis